MEVKKLFTTGLNGLKDISFKNLSDGSGINLIYFTDNSSIAYKASPEDNDKNGVNFISRYLGKSYFNTVVLPPNFTFYNQRVSMISYLKFLKGKLGSKLRLIRKINKTKADLLTKSTVIDFTALSLPFQNVLNNSEMKAATELLKLIESVSQEIESTFYRKDTYVLLDVLEFGDRSILESLLQYSRVKNHLLQNTKIKGFIVYVDGNYWPLTKFTDSGLTGSEDLTINLQVYNKIIKTKVKIDDDEAQDSEMFSKSTLTKQKELHSDLVSRLAAPFVSKPKTITKPTEINKLTSLKSNSKSIYSKMEKRFNEMSKFEKENKFGKLFSKEDQTKFNTMISDTQNELMFDDEIKGTIEDKTQALLKHDSIKKFEKQIQYIKDINYKFNGSITIEDNLIARSGRNFYDPLRALGLKTFTAYNKQKTEFDEVLDESMFDLFKGIEADQEAGIKVKDIKINFEDNFKNRYKVYKIKIQNTKFGFTKPYTIEFKVPYPTKGKYLKIDSKNYIMLNQLFPYPILKTQPNAVKIYTHYSTAGVELKGSSINSTDGLKRIKEEFIKITSQHKILKSTNDLDSETIQKIKDDFNLPNKLNDELLFNIRLK